MATRLVRADRIAVWTRLRISICCRKFAAAGQSLLPAPGLRLRTFEWFCETLEANVSVTNPWISPASLSFFIISVRIIRRGSTQRATDYRSSVLSGQLRDLTHGAKRIRR